MLRLLRRLRARGVEHGGGLRPLLLLLSLLLGRRHRDHLRLLLRLLLRLAGSGRSGRLR